MQKEVVVPRQQRRLRGTPALATYRITAHLSNRPQIGTMRQRASLCSLLAAAAALQPAARKPTGGRLPTRALQPAARKPTGARLPTRRHMSAEQTDPVLEVERLENAIAASTEPDEQKELAEKLGMSRMSAEMSV